MPRQARAVIRHTATQDLSFSGSEVARLIRVDRSAVSRAVLTVENDPDFLETARMICGAPGFPEPETSQHRDNVLLSYMMIRIER